MEQLDHESASTAAFLDAATMLFRGAAWSPFGVPGLDPNDTAEAARSWVHGALGATHAHVTAPLRRLVDRFGAEAALAAAAGRPVPRWATDGMAAAAKATAVGSSRASRVDRESVDAVEARCAGQVRVGVIQQVRLVSARVPAAPEFEVVT